MTIEAESLCQPIKGRSKPAFSVFAFVPITSAWGWLTLIINQDVLTDEQKIEWLPSLFLDKWLDYNLSTHWRTLTAERCRGDAGTAFGVGERLRAAGAS